jgi:hypothetical protein
MDHNSSQTIASLHLAIRDDADPPDELMQRCDVNSCA